MNTLYGVQFWHNKLSGTDVLKPGWYWAWGQIGCLPDGDPIGPFLTEEEAEADAEASFIHINNEATADED